jgi:urease accessory protein
MTAGALLKSLHLASTTLPVGAFSYSQGLETAVERGIIADRADAARWIEDALRFSLGRCEAPLMIAALRGWRADDAAGVAALDEWMRVTRETAELRAETAQMGYSLRRWCIDTEAIPAERMPALSALGEPTYPVVFAAIAAAWDLGESSAATAYLWGWLENQVNAALKAVPLGQTDGQKILLGAAPLVAEVAAAAIARAGDGPDEWPTQCPALAIASAQHEVQYSRLFRS